MPTVLVDTPSTYSRSARCDILLATMSANNPISIPAHFDGERILLDEPVELKRDARLIVTVLPNDEEREPWLRLSATHLDVPTTATATIIPSTMLLNKI